jgi:NADH dehydrogenase
MLIDGAPRVLMPFPEDLAQQAARALAKLGVQVKTGVMVKDIDKGGVTIEMNNRTDRLAARTVIWAGGVTVSALGRTLANRTKADTDRGGRIKVNPDLTIANYPDIYVVGDLALALGPNGKPLPGVAQVAMQQGTYAAKAIMRKVQGAKALPPFKYFDKGDLAVIGRAAAVANIFGLHISGLPAWLVWAFIHLMYIVQFQSRILVFIQWAIQDLTFNRGARLITGPAATDFDFNKEMASPERERAV